MEQPTGPEPSADRGGTPRISRETLFGLGWQSPAAAPKEVRLRGVVRSGVERHSRVLVGPQGETLAQLMGGPPDVLTDGRPVVVTGSFVTDLVTTAQQGRPFRVRMAVLDEAPD